MFNTVCISFGIIIINIIIIIYSISDCMFNVQITQLNFLSLKLQKPILTSFWITRNIWVWINPQQSFLCLLLHLQLLVSIVLMTLLYHIWEHRDDIFILLCYLTSVDLKVHSHVWDHFWQLKTLYKWWKMQKFTPKALFVLKIFKFLFWLFWSCSKTA